MDRNTDLHIHTNYSDGAYSVYEIFKKAKANDLKCISITDHDTLKAYPEAHEIAKDFNIELVTGLELSTEYENREIHILGYFLDINNSKLQNYLTNFRHQRIKRAQKIIEKLNNLDVNITFDDVIENSNGSLIARNHIAFTLVRNKYASGVKEAFEKYIGDSAPAFEKKIHLHPKNLISLINESGGVSVLAHPQFIPEHHLKYLIECGIDGIEVFHPSHSQKQINYFKGIVSNNFLLITGGSDFHGGFRNDEENFSKYNISYDFVQSIKQRIIH